MTKEEAKTEVENALKFIYTREHTAEVLEALSAEPQGFEEYLKQYLGENDLKIIGKDVWEETKANVEQTEWVSVKDRLPTKEESIKNGEMFIVSDGERTYAEYFDRNGRGFGEPTLFGFRIDRAVVAWRELPSPYKGEE